MNKKTSIIILAHKEFNKFYKMFETLIKHTHYEETPYEIIVIGNNPEPEIIGYLLHADYPKEIKLKIKIFDENLGTSKGFNYGAKIAKGYYLCFFNSDYYMIDNWLKSMIDCFEHQPKIGIVSCCTNVSGNEDEKVEMIIRRDKYVMRAEDEYKETDCCLAQMFTTKDIWREVEGFDERFFPVTFEDLDFSEKIKQTGYKLFVNKKCFGYHDYEPNKETGRNEIKERNRKLFYEKWGIKHIWA